MQGEATEPALTWLDGGDPPVDQISIHIHSGWNLLLIAESGSGTFFCVAQVRANPAILRGGGGSFAVVDTIGECSSGW